MARVTHRDLLTDSEGRIDIRSLDLDALCDWVESLEVGRHRGRDLWKALWQDGVHSFDEMNRFAPKFRRLFARHAYLAKLEPALVLKSKDGSRKFLWRLEDGKTIESVLIPDDGRVTLCLSSQVGCAMACTFCLTGDLGLIRQLKPSEIALQVLQIDQLLAREDRITNLVYMGMGEPVHNLDNLCVALDICMDDDALNLSHRRITVSTVGLIPKFVELAKRSPVNLAVSLNASTEEHRRQIMPITKKYSIEALLDACREMSMPTGKRIAFEYVLFEGQNDSMEDAQRVLEMLVGIKAKVNLIPYNENPERELTRPRQARVDAFQKYFLDNGMTCTVRTTRGLDISAACGQLGKASEQAKDNGWLQDARSRVGMSS